MGEVTFNTSEEFENLLDELTEKLGYDSREELIKDSIETLHKAKSEE